MLGAQNSTDSSAQKSSQTLEISTFPTEFTSEIDGSRPNAPDDNHIEDEDDAFKTTIDSAIPERKVEPQLGVGGGVSLVEFADNLYEQFINSGNTAYLDAAIVLFRKGIAELPEENAVALHNLGCALKTRFRHAGGQQIDLDEAISLYRQALKLFSPLHPNRSDLLTNLANALENLFERGGQQNDLDEAISFHRQALNLRLVSHPKRSDSLNSLASLLWTKFEQKDQKTDLDEAILLFRQVLDSPFHLKRFDSLNNLGVALWTLFGQNGLQIHLDEAISLLRQALELPHPNRSSALTNLANALSTRFEQKGLETDLDEAISFYKQSLNLGQPHSTSIRSLNNLANALLTRFRQRGRQNDLDDAISLCIQTLELFPPPHPNRSIMLNNLASALQTRFDQRGQKIDLDEIISLLRQALDLQFPPHPKRSLSLNNLATALVTRSRQKGHQNDLDEAISLHLQTVELFPPPNPNRSNALNNLANTLLTRFWRRGQEKDLDDAISFYLKNLELFPPPHSNRSTALNNLAKALYTRFEKKGQQADLDEAISLNRQALDLRPSPHPDRSQSLTNLALALSTKFDQGGQQIDLDEAMSTYRTATQYLYQPPSRLLNTAKKWIKDAKRYEHISVIDAYDTALQALPQVAALSFDVQSRQEALAADSDGLARDASICAIRRGNLDKAIEFLEAGRSIFWTQILSLRSPFDQLEDVDSKLAGRMREIATALELGSHRDVSVETLDNQQKLSAHQEVSQLNRLSEEWVESIDQVRKLKGFEDFLRPSRLSSLKAATSRYPVIFLVASHCLIMTSASVHHIPLPNLDVPKLKALVHLVHVAVHRLPISRSIIEVLLKEVRGTEPFEHHKLGSSDDVFRLVLKTLWDELVKPVIKYLDIKTFSKSSEMPILQWCPTGHFTFLPIHAAGNYDEQAVECAAVYFISSYTPTVGALLAHPLAAAYSSRRTFKMMVVVQTKELPSAKTELEKIQRHIPSDALVVFGVPGAVANVETVASCLSEASIVHFACHGTQDRLKPLNSGLKLDDGLLRISRIMKEKTLDGSLAFLCACETAMGDEKLPDEAMNLGASLLFSGFQSVIATMWKMADKDGPIIADAFYEELFRGSDLKPALEADTTKSAQALHDAVKKLRSQNASFGRWIPFINIGK